MDIAVRESKVQSVGYSNGKSERSLSACWTGPHTLRMFFCILLYVNCFGRTVLYMCIEYHI